MTFLPSTSEIIITHNTGALQLPHNSEACHTQNSLQSSGKENLCIKKLIFNTSPSLSVFLSHTDIHWNLYPRILGFPVQNIHRCNFCPGTIHCSSMVHSVYMLFYEQHTCMWYSGICRSIQLQRKRSITTGQEKNKKQIPFCIWSQV